MGSKTPEELAAFIEVLREERKERKRARKAETNRNWYVTNLDKAREQTRNWRATNLAKTREIRRNWRAANVEKARASYRSWYAANPEKVRDRGLKWRTANPDKVRGQNLKNYGLTVEEWEVKFEEQGRCCAICRSPTTKGKNWHTDHCAKTGLVRNILCLDCNRTVANHSPAHLRACADYVEEWLKYHSNEGG